MLRSHTRQNASEMRNRLADFLTRNLDDPVLGWPLLGSLPERNGSHPSAKARAVALRVLIVGDLTLELPVEIEATRAQLLAALHGESDKRKLRWKVSKARVGGFVAHAANAAIALGMEVSVCTVVPVPIPNRLREFFKQNAIEKRFVTGVPGPCPLTVVFSCKDGPIPIHRRTVVSAAGLDWPSAAETKFDVILMDPCCIARRNRVMRSLAGRLDRTAGRIVVGMRIDHECSLQELAPTHDKRVWTFVRHHDAQQLAERIAPKSLEPAGNQNEESVARCLQNRYGISKLVIQMGARGAVLLNGIPCPYRVHTCPLEPTTRFGSGATLLTVTTLSSAVGANDRTSLRRGVAAATGLAAGLDLPRSFEELDVV